MPDQILSLTRLRFRHARWGCERNTAPPQGGGGFEPPFEDLQSPVLGLYTIRPARPGKFQIPLNFQAGHPPGPVPEGSTPEKGYFFIFFLLAMGPRPRGKVFCWGV